MWKKQGIKRELLFSETKNIFLYCFLKNAMEKTIFFHEICFFEKFRDDGVGVSSVSLRLTAPSAEGAKGDFVSAGARRWTEPVWQLSDRPRHPFGPPTLQFGRNPTLAGRGGSVSRRDHNQAYWRDIHLPGGTKQEKRRTPNATRSSGEGVWGRGASLREAASPPEYLSLSTFIVCLTEVWQDFIMKTLFVHIQSPKMNAALKKIKEVVPWTFRP